MAKEVAPIVQKIQDPEAFIAGLQVPAWIFDQQTLAFLAVNNVAVERYGYSREQFLHMTILDIRPAEDVPKMLRRAVHPHEKGPSDRDHGNTNGRTAKYLMSKSPVTNCSLMDMTPNWWWPCPWAPALLRLFGWRLPR